MKNSWFVIVYRGRGRGRGGEGKSNGPLLQSRQNLQKVHLQERKTEIEKEIRKREEEEKNWRYLSQGTLHFNCSVRLWLIHLTFFSSISTEVIVITEGDRFVCSKIMFPWNGQHSWSSCVLLAELSHACYFTNVHGQVSLQIHNSYSDTCSLKISCCNIA